MAGSLAHHAFPVIQDFGSRILDWQCKGSGAHGAAALLRQSRQGAGPMEGAACGEQDVQHENTRETRQIAESFVLRRLPRTDSKSKAIF
jgi:hypothetical protein